MSSCSKDARERAKASWDDWTTADVLAEVEGPWREVRGDEDGSVMHVGPSQFVGRVPPVTRELCKLKP